MTMGYSRFEPTSAAIDKLLDDMSLGRLVTGDGEGNGFEVALLPFIRRNGCIEIHLNARDPQLEQIARDPVCSFHVDDLLSGVPSHWIDPEDARFADALYRAVTITGVATLHTEPEELIDHLEALIRKHQPDGKHAGLASSPGLYEQTVRRVTMIRISESRRVGTFRLSQQEPEPTRRRIMERLRERGRDRDIHTANLVGTTLTAEHADA